MRKPQSHAQLFSMTLMLFLSLICISASAAVSWGATGDYPVARSNVH
ncbi:MAG: hypothetical protein JO360_00130 [Acidobacteria bacterium]|nr:hypothetical protein [Acidobacteriota bacterium]